MLLDGGLMGHILLHNFYGSSVFFGSIVSHRCGIMFYQDN